MTRRLLRWFRRESKEEVRPRYTFGHGSEDILCECRADYQCEHNGPLLLPAVHSVDPARPAAHVLGAADGQPTAGPPTTDRTPVTVDTVHEGATEDFGDVLRGMREDLAHDTGSLDPDDRVWDELLAEFDGRLAQAHMDFLRGWSAVERELDHVAPGWADEICPRRDCPLCAHTFDEVMQVAGVIALPAVPVDYSTAEWPVVVTA